jgi:hypothetical protein
MKKVDQTSSELAFFKEKQYVIELIEQVISAKENINGGQSVYDDVIHKILVVLDKYQEQPQLLGSHVVDLINPINVGLLAYLEGVDKVGVDITIFRLFLILSLRYRMI